MSKNSGTAINWITGAAAAYFIGTAIAGAIKRKREQGAGGIGSIGEVERIKRRIYKEISIAQDAGIDFAKDFAEFTDDEIELLAELGHNASWEQKEQKPYAQAYYESLRKAWNAISGLRGIGKAYNVKDADGNTVLTWIEDAAAHVAREKEIEEKRQRTLEAEKRAEAARKSARATDRAIQRGQMSLFGCGYADEVEHELWEIWREQIEYGQTDYDFDTWRKLFGDVYAQADVLPYM